MSSRFIGRRGYSLIEMMVVIAIIVVLIGILLPAVQQARAAANRTKCQSNMRQVALAMFTFHDDWGCFPPYNNTMPQANVSAGNQVYGAWPIFLLPYLDQNSLWAQIVSDDGQFGNQPVAQPSQPSQTYLDALAVWQAMLNAVPSQVQVTTTQVSGTYPPSTTYGNGYTITTPGGSYSYTAYTYNPPQPSWSGSSGSVSYYGIYSPTARGLVQKVLQCPSDPSLGSDGNSNSQGQVYLNSGTWGSTNYLANWNVLTIKSASSGYLAPPNKIDGIPDGCSTTILLGEAYAVCQGISRTWSLAWHANDTNLLSVPGGGVHNFGLTGSMSQNTTLTVGTVNYSFPNGVNDGLPNPQLNGINFMFQIKPLTDNPCPSGFTCCDNLTVQSNHTVLNVAMADGSVHGVSATMSTSTWTYAMLPNDGQPLGSDW